MLNFRHGTQDKKQRETGRICTAYSQVAGTWRVPPILGQEATRKGRSDGR